jgi:hypothetical protein
MFKNSKREEAYRKLAYNGEMNFLGKDEYGVKSYLSEFKLFQYSSGKVEYLCQKKSSSLEFESNVFDYQYTISTGKSSVTIQQSVYFVNSKSLDLPIFIMKPEGLMNKLGTYFGIDDIDFEDHPEFSDNYYLKGDDEEFIRHHFDGPVLKFFSKTAGWTIEASNYYLIFYRNGELIPEEALFDFYRTGEGIYNLFKEVD